MFTIPIHIYGTDQSGQPFEATGRTITLNRHGARIQVAHPLRRGDTIRVVNSMTQQEARYRIVGPVAPPTEKIGEWGVECIEDKVDLWGIYFPPAPEGESSDATALIECGNCHAAAVLRLSLVEVEVLETSGIITEACEKCSVVGPWSYSEKHLGVTSPSDDTLMQAAVETEARGANLRKYKRVTMRLPLRVRDYYGGMEIIKSENVSKGGLCFASDKNYHVGEGVMVICPYTSSGQNIEVRGRIVRQHLVSATHRKIYGVRYEAQAS